MHLYVRHKRLCLDRISAGVSVYSIQQYLPVCKHKSGPLFQQGRVFSFACRGKELTRRLCLYLHSTAASATQRHHKDKWNEIIVNMTLRGLEASDADLDKVAAYLAAI